MCSFAKSSLPPDQKDSAGRLAAKTIEQKALSMNSIRYVLNQVGFRLQLSHLKQRGQGTAVIYVANTNAHVSVAH
jgi:hypothetical protein